MIDQSQLRRKWRSTVRTLIFVNVVGAGILASLIYDRLSNGAGPSIELLIVAGCAMAIWSVIIFYVARAIRSRVWRTFGEG